MTFLFVSSVIAFVFDFLLGIFVFLKNPRKRLNIIYALFLIFYSLWIFSDFFYNTRLIDFLDPTLTVRISHIGAVFIPVLFLHFVFEVTKKDYSKLYFIILYSVSAVFEILNIFTPYFISSVSYIQDKDYLEVIVGPAYYVFLIAILIISFYCYYYLIRYRKSFKTRIRRQVNYILFGSVFVGLTILFYFPYLFGWFNFRLDNFLLIMYFSTIAFAITKSSLLDISIVLTRSVSFVLLGATVGICTILLLTLNIQNPFLLGTSLFIVNLFWAAFGKSYQEFLITTAKHTFVKGYYNQDKLFKELASQINTLSDRDEIFHILEKTFDKWIKFDLTALILPVKSSDEKVKNYSLIFQKENNQIHASSFQLTDSLIRYFDENNGITKLNDLDTQIQDNFQNFGFKEHSIFIPFRSPEGIEGILILGERSGGFSLSSNDIEFFQNIVSMVNSILFGLIPLEKVQKKYFESKQIEHSTQIMKLVSKKNEDLLQTIQEYNHEIRTPMQAVLTNAEFLPDNIEEATTENLLKRKKRILDNINRANDIISTIIQISEEPQKTSPSYKKINLVKLLEKSAKEYDEPKVSIISKIDDPFIKGVENELHLVLKNIFNNVIEAGGNKVTITVNSTKLDVFFSISDDGNGISDSIIDEMWKPFRSTHVTKGRGLGLSIVHRIINEHNGRIEAKNNPDKGACFTIWLPRY